MRCRPGSFTGFEDIFPASFPKATIEPVNVTPPIKRVRNDQHFIDVGDTPIRTPR
jgi:hypothetical protein